MTRLIDADAIPWEMNGVGDIPVVTRDEIEAMPTVDAVEVVRCKDCKWGGAVCGKIECWTDMNLPPEYYGYYWFCPNGERKEE